MEKKDGQFSYAIGRWLRNSTSSPARLPRRRAVVCECLYLYDPDSVAFIRSAMSTICHGQMTGERAKDGGCTANGQPKPWP